MSDIEVQSLSNRSMCFSPALCMRSELASVMHTFILKHKEVAVNCVLTYFLGRKWGYIWGNIPPNTPIFGGICPLFLTPPALCTCTRMCC